MKSRREAAVKRKRRQRRKRDDGSESSFPYTASPNACPKAIASRSDFPGTDAARNRSDLHPNTKPPRRRTRWGSIALDVKVELWGQRGRRIVMRIKVTSDGERPQPQHARVLGTMIAPGWR